jgi:GNAT superfamily N-acetyltransferase
MEYALLGWPPDGPTLRLDHRRFAYAGKFVMSTTGKAVVRRTAAGDEGERTVGPDGSADDTDVVAAVAFDEDRTDSRTLRYRYITVRADLRGEGLGPRLAEFVAGRAADRGYRRIVIAVNNPFAYEAMYKAGFAWTGRESGLAELVLERPARLADTEAPPDAETYQSGLDRYRMRELGEPEASFLADRVGADPPERVGSPTGRGTDPDA